MTDKNFDENNGSMPDDGGVQPEGAGSDAAASGPEPQMNQDSTEAAAAEGSDDDLTVDDILNAEQTPEASSEDGTDAEGTEAAGSGASGSEHLEDLRRLTAEYANYRRRTEEQRHIEIQRAKGEVAKGILPVLDDLARAQQHGDLVEGSAFAVIAEKVRAVAERLGVVAYGEKGDEFDPQQHEAIFQQPTPGATTSTILDVVEVGYRLGDVELRPAKVVVAVPAE